MPHQRWGNQYEVEPAFPTRYELLRETMRLRDELEALRDAKPSVKPVAKQKPDTTVCRAWIVAGVVAAIYLCWFLTR